SCFLPYRSQPEGLPIISLINEGLLRQDGSQDLEGICAHSRVTSVRRFLFPKSPLHRPISEWLNHKTIQTKLSSSIAVAYPMASPRIVHLQERPRIAGRLFAGHLDPG